ncbi:MAG: hypothetical protein M5U32_05335 [Myxococcota bacterium]|nr:hypothetical protein [Myxococcota bacterium]
MSPSTARETTVATTEAMTIGVSRAVAKSSKITSAANSAPAIGALNVAAMPAAAPHATSVRTCRVGSRSSCPIAEPIAEPICTIGPSRPAEPPEPIVIADASVVIATTRGRITPPRRAIASMTAGTPCPRDSRANQNKNGPTIAPPRAGASMRRHHGAVAPIISGSP